MLFLFHLLALGMAQKESVIPSVGDLVKAHPEYTQTSTYSETASQLYSAALQGGFSYTIQIADGEMTYLLARETCAGRGMIPGVILTEAQNEEVGHVWTGSFQLHFFSLLFILLFRTTFPITRMNPCRYRTD